METRRPIRGLALVDLLALAAMIALAVALGVPSVMRAKELSRRGVCAMNLRTLGATARQYAEDNGGVWMLPAFSERLVGKSGIDYRCDRAGPGAPPNNYDTGEVGYNRWMESMFGAPLQPQGSTAVSTTRAFWMLIRSGDAGPAQFFCPSSSDLVDPTENVNLYYDFTQYANVSYGYQVPFGPAETRPRLDADPRQVFAADKGPFYVRSGSSINPLWQDSNNEPLGIDSVPFAWRPYNSPNHGGRFNGEGQNALRADGSVEFVGTPLAGIDGDNIYTAIYGDWGPLRENLIHGETPQQTNPAPYPGQDAFGKDAFASTDSLIYP